MTEEEKTERDQKIQDLRCLTEAYAQGQEDKVAEILRYMDDRKSKGASYKLSIKVLSGLFNSPYYNSQLLFKIINAIGSPYNYEKLRRYPQVNLGNKQANCLNALIGLNMSIDETLFVFFNTLIREEIALDFLIKELLNKGFSKAEIVKGLSKYWICGEIKKISDEQYIRIAPFNIGLIRLIGVTGSLYKISGEDGKIVNPVEGLPVYFLIKDYKEEADMFLGHYLCTDPTFIENRWEQKQI